MLNRCRNLFPVLCLAAVSALLSGSLSTAQTRPVTLAHPATAAAPTFPSATQAPTEKDLAVTQSQLIKLLRLSPTLTTVIEHDPSLLSNQDYVSRNNPQLAAFLTAHPEIARNPEFYLFTHVDPADGSPDQALERAVWPELQQPYHEKTAMQRIAEDLGPLLAFACFLAAVIWLTHTFLQNRRWGRIFKLQSEVHGKLIDKFSSNQELAAYMETEAGKRFLEAAPIPIEMERQQRMPNAVARVLTPLQAGIVLTLLGAGFLLVRHATVETRTPMLVLGVLVLMPGLGFILSAGVTWVLASRLGLMPENPERPVDSRERQ